MRCLIFLSTKDSQAEFFEQRDHGGGGGVVPVLGRMGLLGSGQPWEDLCRFFERVARWQPPATFPAQHCPLATGAQTAPHPQGFFPEHWVNSALSFTSLPAKSFQRPEEGPELSSVVPKGTQNPAGDEGLQGTNDLYPGGDRSAGPW